MADSETRGQIKEKFKSPLSWENLTHFIGPSSNFSWTKFVSVLLSNITTEYSDCAYLDPFFYLDKSVDTGGMVVPQVSNSFALFY